MAISSVALFALSLACSAAVAEASAFLSTHPKAGLSFVQRDDVERALQLSELGRAEKLEVLEEELLPMYASLPKNEHGNLDTPVVRYALHRYFVQKHAWYVKGLSPATGELNITAPTSILKERAPAYIQNVFEQRLHGQGMGLRELAVFASALTDLIHKEASIDLHAVFDALRLPAVGTVPKQWSRKAVLAYLIGYLLEQDMSNVDAGMLRTYEMQVQEIYPAWEATSMWMDDLFHTHAFFQAPRRNPFVPHKESFDTTAAFVQEFGHRFGSFQNLECSMLKSKLVEMEHQGSGRVRLSRFYAGGLQGDWTFTESVDYLRNLGALDERDPKRPSVVIPNYITSHTNCLTGSGFYSICCSDECEGLLAHLERSIAAPRAAPGRITEVVSALSSETVHAPRNLSQALLARLDEIAQVHGGRVPLHGRLFAQWMHHAYPRECPFPHASGTISPMSPDEWMSQNGVVDVEATQNEMEEHYHMGADLEPPSDAEAEADSLPWTTVEELVADHVDVRARTHSLSWIWAWLRTFMAVVTLVSFAVPLMIAGKVVISAPGDYKIDKLMV